MRAFPKVLSARLSHFPVPFSVALIPLLGLMFILFLSKFSSKSFVFVMKRMNRTVLLSLLTRCHQVLEDAGMDANGRQINVTTSNFTASPPSGTSPVSAITSSRETYDNAYFYIVFVMVFYSFLAMTLLKCLGGDEEQKDPSEEFISTQQFNTGRVVDMLSFEEESGL